MSSRQVLIELQNVTARVRNIPILAETSWKIEAGSHWAVIGPNGSGKSTLVGMLTNSVPVIKGRTVRTCPPDATQSLSFEMVDRLMAREERLEEARHFANRQEETTTAREIIAPGATSADQAAIDRIAQTLDILHLLKRSFACLSSGEIRKVLLARALFGRPQLLILDEPYEGLDTAAAEKLSKILPHLMQSGTSVVLVTHQLNRISRHFTHVLCVKSGRVIAQGPRHEILVPKILDDLYDHRPAGTPLTGKTETPPLPQEIQTWLGWKTRLSLMGKKLSWIA